MASVSIQSKGAVPAFPFAALSAPSGVGSANRLLWKGYLYDYDLGCYCLGKRHYDPFALRFWEPDGLDFLDPSVPGGVNPYIYCLNDPITYTDPTGNSAILAALLIGIGVGALIGGGIEFGRQLIDNRGNWADVDWLSVTGSAFLGGTVGAATVLGGAAGMVYAGFAVEGYALSAGASLAISSAAVAAGNMLNYSFSSHGNVTPEGLWNAAWKGALKGAITFGLSFYSGTNGLFLRKTRSGIPAEKFFFVRPQSVWVRDSLVYYMWGEMGLRAVTVSAPGAFLRWFVDQW